MRFSSFQLPLATLAALALLPAAVAADAKPGPAAEAKPAAAATADAKPTPAKFPDVIASYGEQKITKDDVFSFLVENVARQGNLQPHELLTDVVDEMVARRLVDAAAAKEGKAGEAWLQEQVTKRAKEPTDAEVSAFYEQVKPQLGSQTLEQASRSATTRSRSTPRRRRPPRRPTARTSRTSSGRCTTSCSRTSRRWGSTT